MIKRGQNIPFDIYGIETIYFDTDLVNAESAKNKIGEQIELIEKGEFNVTNPITPVHINPLIQKALQDSKRELNENEVLLSILENVNYLTNATIGMQREISSLKEPVHCFGNLGTNFYYSDYTYSDFKSDLDSINQELYLLEPILGILRHDTETLKDTCPVGEGWIICEADARVALIEKRIEFLKKLKIQIQNIGRLPEIKTNQRT